MYAPCHQVKFLVCANLPGNKPVSVSDSDVFQAEADTVRALYKRTLVQSIQLNDLLIEHRKLLI